MDLNFPLSGDNIAGVLTFWFVPLADVLSQAGGDVTLAAGKEWYTGGATRFRLNTTEKTEDTPHGPVTEVELVGFIPRRSSPLDAVLEQMVGRTRYLVIYQDYNGYRKLLGSIKQGLRFSWKHLSGQRPGEDSGVEFGFHAEMAGQGTYAHTAAIAASQPGEEIQPNTDPVVVKWGSTVIAVAQPGQTVTIISEFTADEILIT